MAIQGEGAWDAIRSAKRAATRVALCGRTARRTGNKQGTSNSRTEGPRASRQDGKNPHSRPVELCDQLRELSCKQKVTGSIPVGPPTVTCGGRWSFTNHTNFVPSDGMKSDMLPTRRVLRATDA